jgi:hypothetical protein
MRARAGSSSGSNRSASTAGTRIATTSATERHQPFGEGATSAISTSNAEQAGGERNHHGAARIARPDEVVLHCVGCGSNSRRGRSETLPISQSS